MQNNKITDNELEQVSGGTNVYELVYCMLAAGTNIYDIPYTYHSNIIYTVTEPTLCSIVELKEKLPKIRLEDSSAIEGYVIREAIIKDVVIK